ncbi:Flp family type IVb pilin [Ruegeria sp.]|uniref:Flp family type IVb pilin n=1 Tax=Ruegeria sp. TaxID=1879320 RepID=UPI003B595727
MIKFIKNFRKDEDGAVTVDWVVLTAAIVGLAAVAYTQVGDGVDDLAGDIDTALTGVTVSAPDAGPTTP